MSQPELQDDAQKREAEFADSLDRPLVWKHGEACTALVGLPMLQGQEVVPEKSDQPKRGPYQE